MWTKSHASHATRPESFTPPMTAIHQLVRGGTIGDVVTVDMHWPLDVIHGASYFRRWNGRRKFSGGLQVHKSTHHFDLVNWIIGELAYYWKQRKRFGVVTYA